MFLFGWGEIFASLIGAERGSGGDWGDERWFREGLSTYAQRLRLHIISLSPKQPRSRHGLVLFVPVRDARAVNNGRCVHDGHGIGGEQFPTAVVLML